MKHSLQQHKCATCDLRRLSTELAAKPKPKRYCAVCKRAADRSCGSCESIWYCGPQHQALHWHKSHQQECDHLRSEHLRESQLRRHDSNGELTKMFQQSRRNSLRNLEDLENP